MKKLALISTIALFLFGCKDNNSATSSHPESHTAKINFTVSDASNISSYNIYRGDDIIMQMPASDNPNSEYTVEDDLPITEHPYSLSYSLEPVFMDSTNANTEIKMSISIDSAKVAQTTNTTVNYGDLVNLTHSGE